MSTEPRAGRAARLVRWLSLGDRATAIAMGLLVLYYVVTWGPWQGKASGDGWFGFLYLKAIFYHHTLDMKTVAPEYLRFFGEMGPGHHMPNRCPFGPVLLWLPLYALVAIPEWILLKMRLLPQAAWNGQSPVHVWVTGLATLAAVLVGWRQTLALFMRHAPLPFARIGALAVVWATPLVWYACHQPFYQHGIAFLCIATFFEHWDRTHGELGARRFVWQGLVLGYAASVRAQEIVYVLPLALELLVAMVRGPRRLLALRGAFIAALAFVVAFLPQILVWRYYSGKIAPVQAEPIRWNEPWPLVVLFSTRAGLFTWSPVAYLGVLGVGVGLVARGATGRLMRAFSLAFAVGFYVVACAWTVPGAYAFGARRLCDAMGLVGLGIALLLARIAGERARRIVVWKIAALIVINVALMQCLRARVIASPGSQTRSLAAELEQKLKAPPALVALAARVGWPFAWPVSVPWSIAHQATPAVFETVVGELLLERDGQWITLLTRTVDLTRPARFHVSGGLRWPDAGPGHVTGPVRIPLHMFARESTQLLVIGRLGEGPMRATWNGAPVAIEPHGRGALLPKLDARAGYDELVLELPTGSSLERLELTPLQPIARPSFP